MIKYLLTRWGLAWWENIGAHTSLRSVRKSLLQGNYFFVRPLTQSRSAYYSFISCYFSYPKVEKQAAGFDLP